MEPDRERIAAGRPEPAAAPSHWPAAASPVASRPAGAPPGPPVSGTPYLLGALGLVAFLIGFVLAFVGGSPTKEIEGLVSMVVGSILIAGAFIVDAITQLRADLWRARHGGPR
ncbi:MAG TPA: hypothetical protein VEL75_09730 [Candidatus Methylomirabilis sp.]|nr:hypothetical protein [Candidatus Methylomirabilis sp.]